MVRSGILPQTTLGGKHLSAPQVLAPRRDPLRETRLNLSRFLNTGVLNRLHPTPINQYALACSGRGQQFDRDQPIHPKDHNRALGDVIENRDQIRFGLD